MKKYILLLTTILFSVAIYAQSEESKKEYRKHYREGEIKFIQAQEIMSDAEFAEFSVIYNKYKDERKKVRQENKQLKPDEGVELTDEQAAYNLQAKVNKTVKFAELYKVYIAELRTKLSDKQILAIEQAQAKYKKIMFKQLRDDSVKAVSAMQQK